MLPVYTLPGAQTHNLDLCPAWEFNPKPSRAWDEPHRQGLKSALSFWVFFPCLYFGYFFFFRSINIRNIFNIPCVIIWISAVIVDLITQFFCLLYPRWLISLCPFCIFIVTSHSGILYMGILWGLGLDHLSSEKISIYICFCQLFRDTTNTWPPKPKSFLGQVNNVISIL